MGACIAADQSEPTKVQNTPELVAVDTFSVDPLFVDFYEYLGGMNVLGPAITPKQESGELKTQYLSTALMVYDPQAGEGEHYRLAPLGLVLGVAEPAIENPGDSSSYINGHIIDPIFLNRFEELGGVRIVGRPLTEARYNLDYKRFEQYFENLGLYIRIDDPEDQVRLLAYGAYTCDRNCRFQPHQWSIPSLKPPLVEPFASKVAEIGSAIVGKNLTESFTTLDGNIEVIFENLVLNLITDRTEDNQKQFSTTDLPMQDYSGISDQSEENEPQPLFLTWLPQVMLSTPDLTTTSETQSSNNLSLPILIVDKDNHTNTVELKPIVELIGIRRRPLVGDNKNPLMVFYPLEGNLGHNVPKYFDRFLDTLGGLAFTGNPISEVYPLNGGIYRQCFENVCLDFNSMAEPGEQLKLAPLGIIYKQKYFDPKDTQDNSNMETEFQLQVRESKAYVTINEGQEIEVLITDDGNPVVGQDATLILTLPDNNQIEYHLHPTDEYGRSNQHIPAISAPLGSLVAYQVCSSTPNSEEICVEDNYLIWK